MRLVAIGMFILSGAIMAAAGTIAESIPEPGVRRSNEDQWGILVVTLGGVLLLSELYIWSSPRSSTLEKSGED